MTHIDRKNKKIHALKCWMLSLRAKGFFCSLDVFYGGIGMGKLQFLIQKNSPVNFYTFLVIKTLDPEWTGSGSIFSLK
jgi:hypothetical protein